MSEGERPEEGAGSGAGVTGCFEPVTWVLATDSGPLQEPQGS